jgi:dihydroanticapsin dehydrogenase
VHPTDITDEAAVTATFERIQDAGPLDALVVTAGIQLHDEDGPAQEVSLDAWQRTLAVNLTGAFLCCRGALPALRRQARSSVVLVGSPTALTMSGAGYTAYSASKAGMMSLARTMAADYAADGLRANVLVPGTMVTPLTEQLMADPQTRTELVAGTPLGRLGQPEDLVGLATWLVGDESGFATGATFAVDGGLTVR